MAQPLRVKLVGGLTGCCEECEPTDGLPSADFDKFVLRAKAAALVQVAHGASSLRGAAHGGADGDHRAPQGSAAAAWPRLARWADGGRLGRATSHPSKSTSTRSSRAWTTVAGFSATRTASTVSCA
jgi:hypothetical protein